MKVTIGMACFQDFDGPWFTLNSLRLHHNLPVEVEYIVVGNAPDSKEEVALRAEIAAWMPDVKYIAMSEPVGTSAPRNRIFDEASGELVVVMDSHVLLDHGWFEQLLKFYSSTPGVRDDLFHGPLLYPDLKTVHAKFKDVWDAAMWGKWESDPRASSYKKQYKYLEHGQVQVNVYCDDPFEIDAMGLGLFAARRISWLRFNDRFRQFGGEEWYIHEKYRQAGRKVWCLPGMRFVHRFADDNREPIKYPNDLKIRFKNYVIGLTELDKDLAPAIAEFTGLIGQDAVQEILDDELGRDARLDSLLQKQRDIDRQIEVLKCET